MKVLVVSEGKHESSGALKNLLTRLGGDRAQFKFDRVSNRNVHAWHGRGDGYFKRAVGWLKEAKKRDFDAMVFLIDEDGQRERSRQIGDAQDSTLSRLPRAMGVTIRAFDAWMLADETTLGAVLDCAVARQADPETIRDPKQLCAGLLANSQNQMTQSAMYARIMAQIDIAVLDSRCPSGFRPFANRVRRLFERK